MPFKKADPQQKFLKMGIYGPPGSGKTFTTLQYAERLAEVTGKRVAFVDTERGTDFYVHENKARKVHPKAFDFDAIYTRSLAETYSELAGDPDNGVKGLDFDKHGVIVVDSISHLWDAAISAYEGKMNSNDAIPMNAWSKIKKPYKALIQFLMDAPAHIFILGRQKNVFDNSVEGELRKVGVAMKAEGETAYEPHICCRMEARQNEKDTTITHYFALFEKDRTGVLSGRTYPNPNADIIDLILPCLKGSKQAQSQDLDDVADQDSVLFEKQDAKRLDKESKSKEDLALFTAEINSAQNLEGLGKVAEKIKKRKRYMMGAHTASLEIVYKSVHASLANQVAKGDI